jgi:hypothetical protein
MPRRPRTFPDGGGAPLDPEPDPGLPDTPPAGPPGDQHPPVDPEPHPSPPVDRPGGPGGAPVDPEPDPGVPETPPQFDAPDIAVQLFTCLDRLDLLQSGVAERVRADILESLRATQPGADVRVDCVAGKEHIGMWREPVPDDEHVGLRHQRRNEALAAIDLLEEDDHIAFRIKTALVKAQARAEWQDLPKRYDSSGKPDKDGPVRLRYLRVGFPESRRVRTTIGAKWRAIKFRIHVEDTLSLGHGRQRLPLCDSKVRIRPRVVSWGLAVVRGVMVVLFPRKEMDIESGVDGQGAGCALTAELPRQFLVPGEESKIEISYQRLETNANHLDAGATIRYALRRPKVTIDGPPHVRARTPQAMFSARATDLRDPDFLWTSDGTVASPRSPQTSILFSFEPSATKQVRVTASDDDGVRASATHSVRLVDEPDRGGNRPGRPPEEP